MEDPAILSRYLATRSSTDFERLVEVHGSMVFGAALRHTRHRALAEEITQEVFVILVRKAAAIREPHKLGAWLHRTTLQCAANANRREARRRRIMDEYANELPKSTG
ncbi:MAG: sigma factor, partial [Bacteroidota bacterium]